MIARAEFDRMPPEPERLAWCDWLRHHTINPHDVVATGGWVEADYDTYRITYLAYDRDEHGRKYILPGTEQAARSVRVLQLEARPSPFPDTVRC